MKIFDGHCHIEKGLDNYDLENVVAKNIIFNNINEYKQLVSEVKKEDSVSLIFDFKHNLDFVLKQIDEGKISALKIHSREQKLTYKDYPVLIEKLKQVKKNIPIIVDAFYYDHHTEHQPSLQSIIDLAVQFPKKKIIVAHSGGHKILEYFFHLRTLKNIYYDLSFSLQYLHDSSCYPDLIKLIRYTEKSRILFGSDYHWASPKAQINILNNIFNQLAFEQKEKEDILFNNSNALFLNK